GGAHPSPPEPPAREARSWPPPTNRPRGRQRPGGGTPPARARHDTQRKNDITNCPRHRADVPKATKCLRPVARQWDAAVRRLESDNAAVVCRTAYRYGEITANAQR